MIYTIHYLQTICAMKESSPCVQAEPCSNFSFDKKNSRGRLLRVASPAEVVILEPGLCALPLRGPPACVPHFPQNKQIDVANRLYSSCTQKMKSHLTGNAIWRCIQQKKNKFITFTQRACTAERYASWIENVHFWLSSTTACKCMPCCKLCLREQWPWGGISRTPRMMCTPYLDQS